MNYRFAKIINSASANKRKFECSIAGVRDSLNGMTHTAGETFVQGSAKTGWLKGSFSYPWVLICSLVPSIKELF